MKLLSLPTKRQPRPSAMLSPNGRNPEILANLAHELRTPVQVLLGLIAIMRDDLDERLDQDSKEIVERMNTQALDLSQTVNNLMALVPEQTGDENDRIFIEDEVAIASVLADIRPALEAANTRKKLHLDVDLKTAPSVVRTSRKALSAIISNLALNAIKFTECGGVTIQVGQGAVDGIDGIEIEVSDTGPGLDQSALDEATQPFVQLSRSSTRSHRGLGLGLTIVRQYVNQLGGTLGLHSVQGQGATFTVRLPIPAERTQDRCTNALP